MINEMKGKITCPECDSTKIVKYQNEVISNTYKLEELEGKKWILIDSDFNMVQEDSIYYVCKDCNYESSDSDDFGDDENE